MALDIETSGKKKGDALRYADQELIGISLCDEEVNIYVNLYNNKEQNELLSYIKKHLKPELYVMANASFDLAGLNKYGLYTGNESVWDICTSDHLINENNIGKHGLKAQAQRYLGVTPKNYDSSLSPNSKEFVEYALNDSLWTLQIYKHHLPLLYKQGLVGLMKRIEMPYVHCLTQMRITGVTVDWELNEEYKNKAKTQTNDLLIKLCEHSETKYSMQANLLTQELSVETEVNFNSGEQVSQIIINKLGIPLNDKTEKGNIKVDKHTLKKLADKHPFIKYLLEYKALQKLRTAFLSPLKGFSEGDGKIRPNFMNWGTVTGRLSSSKPNLQQLPNSSDDANIQVRKQFTAPPGYKMFTADYSGFELRIMSSISEDDTMIKILNEGGDLHQSTADLMNVDRKTGKIFNFSVAYGKGTRGFSEDLGVNEDEAEKLIDKFNKAYPKVYKEIKNTHLFLERTGFVKNVFGRRRRLPPLKGERGDYYQPNRHKRQSFNFRIQSSAGDILRHASNIVYKHAMRQPEMGLKLVMTVHDENVYIVKKSYLERGMRLVKTCFEKSIKDKVKFLSDVKHGDNYQEAK